MQKNKFIGVLFVFVMLFGIAACGPSTPPTATDNSSDTNANDTSEEQTTATEAENVETNPVSAKGAPETAIEAGLTETDANGIQIGFTKDGHAYRGDPNAPVVVEEFSDFQCPFCSRFSTQTLPSLYENQIMNGDVLFVYYDFPLESIHSQARAAANAARCAGDQGAGAYWAMHDRLFANIQEWGRSNPETVFTAYAEDAELDIKAFTTCLETAPFDDQVQADLDLGQTRDVRSTPTFFVNGQMLLGAQPIQVFNEAIASVQNGESIAEEAPPTSGPTLEEVLLPPVKTPDPVNITSENAAHTLGDPNAPVTIVEYTDYQCPFCQRYALETMPQILSDLIETGEVFYILKDLPLESIHPEARLAANAARCAGEQDVYWEMHEVLFRDQNTWAGLSAGAAEIMTNMANSLGADRDEFSACMESSRHDAAVQVNLDEALRLGVQSTPSFFINGFPLSGARPFETFEYGTALAKEGTLAAAYARPLPETDNAYAIGDPNAPVEIIEFTDFQCPFCSRHYSETFTRVKENYVDTGKVRYVFKDFPLINIHPQAVKAAEAARCAGDQEQYLEMHDMLFETQAEWNGRTDADQLFKEYAATLGLDQVSFAQCLDSGTHEAAVMADLEEGSRAGVNGTPAFFINDHSMSGALPYSIFEEAIELFLADS